MGLKKIFLIVFCVLTFNTLKAQNDSSSFIFFNPVKSLLGNQIEFSFEEKKNNHCWEYFLGFKYPIKPKDSGSNLINGLVWERSVTTDFYFPKRGSILDYYYGPSISSSYKLYLKSLNCYFGLNGIFKYLYQPRTADWWVDGRDDSSNIIHVQKDNCFIAGLSLILDKETECNNKFLIDYYF